MKSVTYLRLDGVNAAGQRLSVYGDFAGGATTDDLTYLVWEKSDSRGGEYLPIVGVNGTEYTPEAGGYYLRVCATLGDKSFKSAPLYIRENADAGFVKAYLMEFADKGE